MRMPVTSRHHLTISSPIRDWYSTAGGDVGALDGRGALVTGGSRGIGRAIVKRLAGGGGTGVFSYLQNEAAAADVVREVAGNGGRAVAVQADQGSLDDLRRLGREGGQELGGAATWA